MSLTSTLSPTAPSSPPAASLPSHYFTFPRILPSVKFAYPSTYELMHKKTTFIEELSSENKEIAEKAQNTVLTILQHYNFLSCSHIQKASLGNIDRIILYQETHIAIFGDSHAQIEATKARINKCVELGYLEASSYKVQKKWQHNFYMVFLGDYMDRGQNSIDVMILLLSLKILNPQQVILIRGNHENMHISERYMHPAEKNYLFHPDNIEMKNAFIKAFQSFPIAALIGVYREAKPIQYHLFTHACIDLCVDLSFAFSDRLFLRQQFPLYEEFYSLEHLKCRMQKLKDADKSFKMQHSIAAIQKIIESKDFISHGETRSNPQSENFLLNFLWGDIKKTFSDKELEQIFKDNSMFAEHSISKRPGVSLSANAIKAYCRIEKTQDGKITALTVGHDHYPNSYGYDHITKSKPQYFIDILPASPMTDLIIQCDLFAIYKATNEKTKLWKKHFYLRWDRGSPFAKIPFYPLQQDVFR